MLLMPPLLTNGQVLWLCAFTIPLLSASLIGAPTDARAMNMATGKNVRDLDKEVPPLPINIPTHSYQCVCVEGGHGPSSHL